MCQTVEIIFNQLKCQIGSEEPDWLKLTKYYCGSFPSQVTSALYTEIFDFPLSGLSYFVRKWKLTTAHR